MAGLHGRAEHGARGTTLYLLPGLTTGQRKAVIRRLRQEASRGFGPPLPQPQLVIALGVDRLRSGARIAGAVVRLHPAVTLLPSALTVAVMALFVIASSAGTGSAPKTRVGFAEPVSAGIGTNARSAHVRSAPTPMAGIKADSRTGGKGLGTGQHVQAKQPGAQHAPVPVPVPAAPARVPVRVTVRAGYWHVWPRVMAGPVPYRPARFSRRGSA